ncbi:MAG: flagellar biosynthesis protein FlgD [Sandarakinorhabdus sp.]|nr:flagellar biosynthesis protein FlgD [Sandarakinorhabdus sp.]
MSMSAITGVRSIDPAAVKAPKKTLDQSDFLALMSAQLKNQDPGKPVDNSEYVAQMAQFSTLSGITESNKSLAAIVERLDQLIAVSTPAKGTAS